jgi:hypothetical protein
VRCVERRESMRSRYFSPADLQFFSRHPGPNILTDARAIDGNQAFTQAPASLLRGGVEQSDVLCRNWRQRSGQPSAPV